MCIACAAAGRSAFWATFDHVWPTVAFETLVFCQADRSVSTGLSPAGPSHYAASGVATAATGAATTDALLFGTQWDGPVTYGFPSSASAYEAGYAEAEDGFAAASRAMAQAVRHILEGTTPYAGGPKATLMPVEGFTKLAIRENATGADIRVAQSRAADPTAYAYMPGADPDSGDVWFGRGHSYLNPKLGSYEFATIIHELGHALGLKHGHELGGVGGVRLPSARDSLEYSVMTYHSYVGHDGTGYTNEDYGFPQTFMMYDIAALQEMYGADFTFRASNTVYKWSPATGETFVNGIGQGAPGGGIRGSANRIFETIWDGGGVDTYDLSNYSTNLSIDLRPGSYSAFTITQRANLGDGHYARGNVFNALQYERNPGSLIENVKGGSGADRLLGNDAANNLSGGSGNDLLYGYGGKDKLTGGSGADIFVFASSLTSSSTDTIRDYSVAADTIRLENAYFQALTRTGTLASSAFHTGSAAHDSSDRIVYNKSAGALYYDADGTGVAAPVKFAQLAAGLGLTHADFYVI
jgi:serralysin